MIEDLFFLEKQTYKKSFIHDLDARVKIIVAFAAIVAMVAVPYSPLVFPVALVFLVFLLLLWGLSRLSPIVYLQRLAVILPFGLFILLVQVFVQNPYYEVFTPVLDLPLGIHVYAESIEFAGILLLKFLVSVSFIILLSSTTRMQDLLEGAGRMGLPAEFTLTLGMMIRYLFVFGYMYRKINESLATRCFQASDSRLPYRYRLRTLAFTIGTLFIRSYEQGERTYLAMLCRGYGRESHLYIRNKPLFRSDRIFLVGGLFVVIATPVLLFVHSLHIL